MPRRGMWASIRLSACSAFRGRNLNSRRTQSKVDKKVLIVVVAPDRTGVIRSR